jgi:hypothetical protein
VDRVSRWISKKIVNIISVKAAKIFLYFFPSPMQACNVLLQLNISSSAMLSWSVVRARPTAAVNWPLEYFFGWRFTQEILWIFFGLVKMHISSALQVHLQQEMAVSCWPTTIIGPGGESYSFSFCVVYLFRFIVKK